MLRVLLPVVWPCLWCVAAATACSGEVALIRTSPQPLCHFYSGTSLGGPHFIGEEGGTKKPLHSHALFTTQVSIWPSVTSARAAGKPSNPHSPKKEKRKKPPPTHGGVLASCSTRRRNLREAIYAALSYCFAVVPTWLPSPESITPPPPHLHRHFRLNESSSGCAINRVHLLKRFNWSIWREVWDRARLYFTADVSCLENSHWEQRSALL